jgi:hypothetical protein
MRNVLILAGVVAMAAVVAMSQGCVQVGGKEPLVTVNRTAPTPPPAPANMPTGPAHATCQQEMSNAMAQISQLKVDLKKAQDDLDECKRDRKNDKNKWEDEKKKLERDRDQYKDRLKRYEKD